MSLYYKGLPAHMRAYMIDREVEGFLGRVQALKNKVVMQAEINDENVGDKLAQLEELKRAALLRRESNKKPKVGQIGMSEQDKQLIEEAKKKADPAYDLKRFIEGAQSLRNKKILMEARRINKSHQVDEMSKEVRREMQRKSVESRKRNKEAKSEDEGKASG